MGAYNRVRISAIAVALTVALAATLAQAGEVTFRKIVVDKTFRAEGAAAGDVNHDGKLDILSGDVWYEAPNWKMHEVRKVGKYNGAKGYSNCFTNFAMDVNGDGWIDSLTVVFPGKECFWYENPKNASGHWKQRTVTKDASNETPIFVDLLGDGTKTLICGSGTKMTWFSLPKDLDGLWNHHAVSGPNAPGTKRFAHGLGAGDVNGDGLNDIIIPQGWWEASKDRTTTKKPWTFHKAPFGPDAADMFAYDIDGDGDNDIISSSAHKYGIWWFEKTDAGYTQHEISKAFSQPHAVHLIDVNGDGLKDIVTGKRYFAHNGRDPGGKDAAVMYWFELTRPSKGKVKFVAHKIDDDSGVGTQFDMADMNGDGLVDIVTSNKKGVYVHLQSRTGAAASPAAGAKPLFDGKTFAGWEGNLDWFRIEDGAIVGGTLKKRIPRNEFLCTKKQYGDFELRLKVKLEGGKGNAGIQFRSARIPNHHEVSGFQADVGLPAWWGALYDESRRNRVLARGDKKKLTAALKPTGWNDYVIRCVGNRIQLSINGYQTVDYTETEPESKVPTKGIIGLQIHGGAPSEIRYKDITIRELAGK